MIQINGSIKIEFGGQELILLPDRAIWWPARSTLVVADTHFGKAASFRTTGVPVPSGSTLKDLGRLAALLAFTSSTRLIVLGDFLHSRAGRQAEVFQPIADWRQLQKHISIILVRGNHDRSAGRVPSEWDIQEVDEPFIEETLHFVHNPDCDHPLPTLAGHVHPVIGLEDYDGSSVTFPCFVVEPACLILPAFGTFTGGYRMGCEENRRIYVLANGRLVPLPRKS